MERGGLGGGPGQGGRANDLCQDRHLGQIELGLEWGPIPPAVKVQLGVQREREKVKVLREAGGGGLDEGESALLDEAQPHVHHPPVNSTRSSICLPLPLLPSCPPSPPPLPGLAYASVHPVNGSHLIS